MSKRLQVLLEEEELKEIQRFVRRKRMTVAEWVRQALRAARREEHQSDVAARLEVIRRASEHSFPTGDIEQMIAEIKQGYLKGPP